MVQLRAYDSDEIHRLAPMDAAIEALRVAFSGRPAHLARLVVPAAGGELLVMPAVDAGAAGVKLLMVQPANASRGEPVIQGTYVIFDADAGRPIALADGAALTSIRTPAVSAVATDALARDDVRTLGIVGSGPQASAHVEAILCVRPLIARIIVASRTWDHAERLVDDLRVEGRELVVGSIAEAAGCDVVCTATRATSPIVTAPMVRPGTHINAVGSYREDMCEIDAELVAECTVYVDDDHAARTEAGDLIVAAIDSSWTWQRVAGNLADLAAGRSARTSRDEITLFKSVGLALEDLVIARLVASRDGLL